MRITELLENLVTEDAMMGKIADSGKIIRILKKAHTVPFSDEKNWLLVDTDPGKGNSGLGIKWIPADTRFEWVRPYKNSVDEAVVGNYADLYHTAWTDNGALNSILQSGKLVPGQNKWLSLTRNSRLDYAKMMGQFAEFVVDQNKLRQRFKLDQYDDFKGKGADEAEERVNVPIPLKGYVKSIHLPASWKHDEKAMQYYEPKLKQYGIPFYYDTIGSPEDRNADVPRLEEASG